LFFLLPHRTRSTTFCLQPCFLLNLFFLRPLPASPTPKKQRWSSFVDAFCDSVHARGLAAVPPPHARANLKATPSPFSSLSSSALPPPPPPPASVLPAAPSRLVAIGDLHGDLDKARRALVAARVLCPTTDRWVGGDTVLVQVGDVLDRGDGEIACLFLLERLAREAELAGGAVHVLNGNHETMNVELDLRYVTGGGFADFADLAPTGDDLDEELLTYGKAARGRVAAFRPGGPYARLLAGHNTAVIVGDTAFVHGGILPDHAETGLEVINDDIQRWMLGDADAPEHVDGDGPLWVRDYSDETGPEECADLEEALAILGVARMVVGHTVYDEINAECDDQVWRVDVGMAAYYGGYTQVLEIRGDDVDTID